jgi:hypothetical protein
MVSPRNLGTAVSGYDVPEGRAWESVVFQAGLSVLDRELNLAQGIEALRSGMPSGWVASDFLNSSNAVSGIFNQIAVANTLEIPNGLRAHVNGWSVVVQHTNATGSNRVSLGAAPASAQRCDFVLLEVWRRLIAASPISVGKSATGKIWQQGNVATDSANDASLNYPDDLLEVNVGSETTKRVQIQYRLRVVSLANIFAAPYGMTDSNVVANSVPGSAAAPNGTATSFTYVNQGVNGDPGLWRSGDGDPGNNLGTVDGYMYALPLLAVFRRNTGAFDRLTNQNGGSGRPDGLTSSQIVPKDLVDLRSGVSPTGWSYAELLEKNTNSILDNTLRTEIGSSSFAGGNSGTTVFWADEVGNLTTTLAGPTVAHFDGVKRRFSDRSIYEQVVVAVSPPGGSWNVGDVVTIDPTALVVYPYSSPINWVNYAETEVRILDVLDARWEGISGVSKALSAENYIESVTGLGAAPVVPVELTIGDNTLEGTPLADVGLTNEVLYVNILVAYPTGVGLTHTPVEDYGANSFFVDTAIPNTLPYLFSSYAGHQSFDYAHREVQLEYETSTISRNVGSGDSPTDTLVLHEKVVPGSFSVTTTPAQAGPPVVDPSGRVVTLATVPNANTVISMTYKAIRPMPQNGERATIYYRYAAPQMVRDTSLNLVTSLPVIPRLVGDKLFSITVGSGSQGDAYPFATAYVQTGGVKAPNLYPYAGEAELSGSAQITVTDFNATTGMLALPTLISMVASPEKLIFTRDSGDIDIEGRTFFSSVPTGEYIPNAYAQDLSAKDRHKNVLPILAELAQDVVPFGLKGQLLLILLVRFAVFDEVNGVFFDLDSDANATTASVFRVKGLLLNKGNG